MNRDNSIGLGVINVTHMNSVVETADQFGKTTGSFLHNYASSLDPGRVGRLMGRGLRTWPDRASCRPAVAVWAARAYAGLACRARLWAARCLRVCGPSATVRLGYVSAGPI